jgi:uncharacterized repeat protein (TIGR03803 family)
MKTFMNNPFPCLGEASRGTWVLAALIVSLSSMLTGRAPAQIFTNLYSFQYSSGLGYTNGPDPEASLVQGNDGDFYGTTRFGGTNSLSLGSSFGTVFKISANGALTTLYSFSGGYDGAAPCLAGLVQGSDGNFYGITRFGGTNNVR